MARLGYDCLEPAAGEIGYKLSASSSFRSSSTVLKALTYGFSSQVLYFVFIFSGDGL